MCGLPIARIRRFFDHAVASFAPNRRILDFVGALMTVTLVACTLVIYSCVIFVAN